MTQNDQFKNFIETSLSQLNNIKQVALKCNANEETIALNDEMAAYCKILQDLSTKSELAINYLIQFQKDVNNALNLFPYRNSKIENLNFNDPAIKQTIEGNNSSIKGHLNLLQFNLDFFRKLGFFYNNIVAIGANGSGKTSLTDRLRPYIQNNGVVISAQRILVVPAFESLSNQVTTAKQLKESQLLDKSNKHLNLVGRVNDEFRIVLSNLLSDNITTASSYRLSAIEQKNNEEKISDPPITNLDKTFKIWNSLIEHREIKCIDGMNITVTYKGGTPYEIIKMSDGEKVMLYLIAQVLQAPESGFIIIDEPEIYLHKTILKKLWDILETARQDCIFVYLTHDLDFATSRITAKKIWIRSFIYPDKWDFENIPENELPQSLLLELLGSRKNVLFCEGQKGSIDEKIYNILFPWFTITPVDNCLSVINYTKAFNKIPNSTIKAFGIIDGDHHAKERLVALKSEHIYCLALAEPENLFFDEEFLKILIANIMGDVTVIEKIKSAVISGFENELELQISNYVSSKINYYFKDSHVSKGNTFDLVNKNYEKFTEEIKIKDWFDFRRKELEEIIREENYSRVLSVFNNKGLKKIANHFLEITNFTEKAIKLLQFQSEAQNTLRKYFPNEITNNPNESR